MAQKYLRWILEVMAALRGPSTEVALGVLLYLVIDTLDRDVKGYGGFGASVACKYYWGLHMHGFAFVFLEASEHTLK